MNEPWTKLKLDLEPEKIYQAIRDGVDDAMWRLMTSATGMPCADFYAAIKDGVAEGIEKVGIDKG